MIKIRLKTINKLIEMRLWSIVIPSYLNSSTTSTLKPSMTRKFGLTPRFLVKTISFVFDKLIVSWLYLTQSRKGICLEKLTIVWDKLSPLMDKVFYQQINKNAYLLNKQGHLYIWEIKVDRRPNLAEHQTSNQQN